MAFIDEMTFHLKAGDGGDGIAAWRHEKGKEFAGAAGGNGGKGGDVYVRAMRDYNLLSKYRNVKVFEAKHGQNGAGGSAWGKNGEDLILNLPIGCIVMNKETGKKIQLLTEGETVFLLKGGRGGFGNEHFKASTNVSPEQFTPGKPGEEGDFYIELELVADVGLVGLPNAGKSSLLNVLTNADAKVGNYAFTTLEPNLGAFYGFIVSDIPGLIEGASEGKGLGHKFLRHVKRTRLILHCLSLENENLTDVYNTVRHELEEYGEELGKKKEIVLLTKTDTVSPEVLKKKIAEVKKLNKNVYTVSVYDDASVKALIDALVKILRKESNDAK